VDDEPGVRDGMSELLDLFGCKVRTADSKQSALAAARLEEPDIALVDYRLRELVPALPAIIISGDTAPDSLREAQAAGIELLSKPVTKDRLFEAISSTCSPTIVRV
jgi:CheY-like chemotaxis protein